MYSFFPIVQQFMPKRMPEGYIALVVDSSIRFQSESWLEEELHCGDVSFERETLIHTVLLMHRFTAGSGIETTSNSNSYILP